MRDIMSLNKVLITGSSSGLGNYMALYFSKKGHDVLLHGRDEIKLKDTKNKIIKNNVKAEYIISDLSEKQGVQELCKKAKSENIKILVNNAGIICPNLPFEKINNEIIDQMILVNLIAPIKIINSISDNLEQVININSMVGLEAKKNRTLYAAGKWGLKGFSDSLKQEEKIYKILDVYPTNIKTWPDRENSMEIEYVLEKIYQAMLDSKSELILDGRK
jgi:short-subunit dehydrogenase